MKKLGLLLIAFAMLIICGSCHMNEKCPAYSDNNVQVEPSV